MHISQGAVSASVLESAQSKLPEVADSNYFSFEACSMCLCFQPVLCASASNFPTILSLDGVAAFAPCIFCRVAKCGETDSFETCVTVKEVH